MQLFYAPDIKGDRFVLSTEDSRHCVKVLRLKEGDQITLTDGLGYFYYAEIEEPDMRAAKVKIRRKEFIEKQWPYRLHIAMAPTKNMNRTEWALEKLTELGVDVFTPLLCDHSERKVIKPARMERIVTAAVKQSLKAWFPEIEGIDQFRQFVERDFKGEKYIAYIDENYDQLMKELYSTGSDAVIMIGPEGDFSSDEVKLALEKGFEPVSLGSSRLRTETAAVAACQTIHLLNQ